MAERKDVGQLVQRTLAGEKDAFAELVKAHENLAFSLAYQHLRNQSDAEDIAQEAFLRAYRDLHKLRDPALFGKWFCGIVLNVVKEKSRGRKPSVPLHLVGDIAAQQAEPDERAKVDMLLGMIARLSDDYRVPLTLHYVQGLQYREIGDALGISEVTARSRVHRARAMLRKALGAKRGG